MKAPKSKSFLSKAYDFFRRKASKDECFCDKSKNPFPSGIYPVLTEPIRCKGVTSPTKKNRQVFQEINYSISVNPPREPGVERTTYLSGRRTDINDYWSYWGQLNSTTENKRNTGDRKDLYEDDDEEEGVFTIQLIKPQCGYIGIVLVGGADTLLGNHFVSDIVPNSPASKSGRVRIGDELLEANDHALRGLTHAEALEIFRSFPTVVKLVVARTQHANRAILKRIQTKKENDNANSKAGSQKKRRSAIEEAVKTSVVPRGPGSVIDVTKKACPYVKPVKRASRVSSFVGLVENVVTNDAIVGGNPRSRENKKKDEKVGETVRQAEGSRSDNDRVIHTILDKPVKEDNAVFDGGTMTPETMAFKSSSPCISMFDLPQTDENNALRFSYVALRGSLNGALKRHNLIERCDAGATWPFISTKQRAPLAWDSFISPGKPVSVRRSSSARFRRKAGRTSVPFASNLSLRENSSIRKPNGRYYIERRTIVVELQRENERTDWGFTIGGGVCSPYGDLPISVVSVSESEMPYGTLRSGDEVIDVSGESFEGITFLEAEKILKNCPKTKVTVTIARKFLQRVPSSRSNPYAEAWSSPQSLTPY